ncbi:MAG: hypothetical protein JW779_06025 [Candidatus Thorarchaeota archaeon]|nr:hypothetical protein [Candidatus Thorarchaeota archaeon]
MSFIRGTFFYYLVLLIGMGLLGVYFWIILTATISDIAIKLVLFLSGIVTVCSTFALARTKSRPGRVSLTTLSGIIGGVHGFLIITLFPEGLMGALLFFWMACGLLLAFAALAWLPETD